MGLFHPLLTKLWLGTIFLVAVMVAVPSWQIFNDKKLPILRDESPGLVFTTYAYEPSPGCPQREWSVGDYLPRRCFPDGIVGHPERVGLETPRARRCRRCLAPPLRIQRWVRVRGDALLVAGPLLAGGEVRAIVQDRFTSRAPAPAFVPQVDDRDYREPPPEYVSSVRSDLLIGPMTLLLCLPFIWWAGFSHAQRTLLGREDEPAVDG